MARVSTALDHDVVDKLVGDHARALDLAEDFEGSREVSGFGHGADEEGVGGNAGADSLGFHPLRYLCCLGVLARMMC
eukprot:207237-Rhodomonas_salina.1